MTTKRNKNLEALYKMYKGEIILLEKEIKRMEKVKIDLAGASITEQNALTRFEKRIEELKKRKKDTQKLAQELKQYM